MYWLEVAAGIYAMLRGGRNRYDNLVEINASPYMNTKAEEVIEYLVRNGFRVIERGIFGDPAVCNCDPTVEEKYINQDGTLVLLEYKQVTGRVVSALVAARDP